MRDSILSRERIPFRHESISGSPEIRTLTLFKALVSKTSMSAIPSASLVAGTRVELVWDAYETPEFTGFLSRIMVETGRIGLPIDGCKPTVMPLALSPRLYP